MCSLIVKVLQVLKVTFGWIRTCIYMLSGVKISQQFQGSFGPLILKKLKALKLFAGQVVCFVFLQVISFIHQEMKWAKISRAIWVLGLNIFEPSTNFESIWPRWWWTWHHRQFWIPLQFNEKCNFNLKLNWYSHEECKIKWEFQIRSGGTSLLKPFRSYKIFQRNSLTVYFFMHTAYFLHLDEPRHWVPVRSTVQITWYRQMAKRMLCGHRRSCPPSSDLARGLALFWLLYGVDVVSLCIHAYKTLGAEFCNNVESLTLDLRCYKQGYCPIMNVLYFHFQKFLQPLLKHRQEEKERQERLEQSIQELSASVREAG